MDLLIRVCMHACMLKMVASSFCRSLVQYTLLLLLLVAGLFLLRRLRSLYILCIETISDWSAGCCQTSKLTPGRRTIVASSGQPLIPHLFHVCSTYNQTYSMGSSTILCGIVSPTRYTRFVRLIYLPNNQSTNEK
jgi:hypothetical protein